MSHTLYDHERWRDLDGGRDLTCAISFGPRGAADAHLELTKSWQHDGINCRALGARRQAGLYVGDSSDSHIASIHCDNMRRSEVMWVAPGMCDLLVTAADSIEVEYRLSQELVPILRGLCFFASTLAGEGLLRDQGHPVPVDAIHWYPAVRLDRQGNAHPILMIDSYGCMRTPHGQALVFSGGSEWELGHGLTDRSHDHTADDRDESVFEDRRLLLALWSLMESRGVVDVVEEPLDRATRRRMERSDMPLDAVRVIYLRGSRAQTVKAHLEEVASYRHQWIVSGHWRSQPYGPNRALRRQVWISPYIKGPADAPLLTGPKVKALVR